MSDEPVKKGFFARINEALYETVDTNEQEAARPPVAAAGPGRAAAGDAVDAPAAAHPLEDTRELGARVRADIAGRGEAFTRFLGLVSSFADIIPEETGRYRAAMKALEKTGNIARNEVLKAANDQLRALGSQREVFAGTLSRKREELAAKGGEAEAIRAKIAELQQSIARLQQEEQGILRDVAAEAGKLKTADEGFSSLLAQIEAEINAAQEKIEKYLPAQPASGRAAGGEK